MHLGKVRVVNGFFSIVKLNLNLEAKSEICSVYYDS